MKLTSRRVPAWWVAAAAALAAAIAAAGSAIAVSEGDPVERMRAGLPAIAADSGAEAASGGSQIVRAETAQRQGKLVYVAASFRNPAVTQSVSGVKCPRRTQAVGGGVLSESRHPGEQSVNSTFPHDGGDRNKRADDGWVAAVDNLTLGNRRFGVYAICRKRAR